MTRPFLMKRTEHKDPDQEKQWSIMQSGRTVETLLQTLLNQLVGLAVLFPVKYTVIPMVPRCPRLASHLPVWLFMCVPLLSCVPLRMFHPYIHLFIPVVPVIVIKSFNSVLGKITNFQCDERVVFFLWKLS